MIYIKFRAGFWKRDRLFLWVILNLFQDLKRRCSFFHYGSRIKVGMTIKELEKEENKKLIHNPIPIIDRYLPFIDNIPETLI